MPVNGLFLFFFFQHQRLFLQNATILIQTSDAPHKTEHNHFLGTPEMQQPATATTTAVSSCMGETLMLPFGWLCCPDCCALCPLHVFTNWFPLSRTHCKMSLPINVLYAILFVLLTVQDVRHPLIIVLGIFVCSIPAHSTDWSGCRKCTKPWMCGGEEGALWLHLSLVISSALKDVPRFSTLACLWLSSAWGHLGWMCTAMCACYASSGKFRSLLLLSDGENYRLRQGT